MGKLLRCVAWGNSQDPWHGWWGAPWDLQTPNKWSTAAPKRPRGLHTISQKDPGGIFRIFAFSRIILCLIDYPNTRFSHRGRSRCLCGYEPNLMYQLSLYLLSVTLKQNVKQEWPLFTQCHFFLWNGTKQGSVVSVQTRESLYFWRSPRCKGLAIV